MDVLKHNRKAWDMQAEKGNTWTLPVSEEIIKNAKQGQWEIVITPTKSVPRSWFPPSMKNIRILCLASGGGQQGPVLAAAGAEVTVLDLSEKQLEKDLYVAKRDNLNITAINGDMTNLEMFEDQSFDMIVHPVSNMYVEDISKVWKEACRVLKVNGTLISGFVNPLVYIFDAEAEDKGILDVKYAIPFSDLKSLPEETLTEYMNNGDPLIFGHSLESQIAGQLEAGFVIAGMYEDNYGGRRLLDKFINTFIATRAFKQQKGED